MNPPLSWWREAVRSSRERMKGARIYKRLTPNGRKMFVRALVFDLLDRVERTTVAQ